jgi:hypothetical protein
MTFKSGDVLRDADNYVGLFRDHDPKLGVFMTVRADDTGADIPRLAKLPIALVASAPPSCATCWYWTAPDQEGGQGVENLCPEDAQAGVCQLASEDLTQASADRDGVFAFAQNRGDASSCLRTKATFGCVMHMRANPGKQPEFDTITQSDTMRSVQRTITLSGEPNGERVTLSLNSFIRTKREWSAPRVGLDKQRLSFSQSDVALLAVVTRELYRAFDRAFGKQR